MCVKAFRTIYGVRTKRLCHLIGHIKEHGPVARQHGNTGRRPVHALRFEQVEGVVKFIKSLSEQFGIPHPASLHGRNAQPPVYLPARMSYTSTHEEYPQASGEAHAKPVGLTSYREIWSQCMPHIWFMTPRQMCATGVSSSGGVWAVR